MAPHYPMCLFHCWGSAHHCLLLSKQQQLLGNASARAVAEQDLGSWRLGPARWTSPAQCQGHFCKAAGAKLSRGGAPGWGAGGCPCADPSKRAFPQTMFPERVSLPASRRRFMNHRVPSNRRYQPTEYEHAANCATHAVSSSPGPRVREDGARLSRGPLRNLKEHLKMSVLSPGAAPEGLGAVMRQICSRCSQGPGILSLFLPWEAGVHPPCSPSPWPRVPREAGRGLSEAGVFCKAP